MAIAFPTPNMGDPSTLIVTEAGITWTWNNTLGVWSTDISSASDDTAIGDTPPASPQEGDLWWNSSDDSGRLYVYYDEGPGGSQQWVEASPQGDTLTESDADTLYLSKVSDDTAEGEITFEKLTTHAAGAHITAGTVDDPGIFMSPDPYIGVHGDGAFINVTNDDESQSIQLNSDGTAFFSGLTTHAGGVSLTGGSFRETYDQTTGNAHFIYFTPVATRTAGSNSLYNRLTHNDDSRKTFAESAINLYVSHFDNSKDWNFSNDCTISLNRARVGGTIDVTVDSDKTVDIIGFDSYIENNSNASVNTYNFFARGNAPNYFAGTIRTGAITATGSNTGDDSNHTWTEQSRDSNAVRWSTAAGFISRFGVDANASCFHLNRLGSDTGSLIQFRENGVEIDSIELDGSGGITYGASDYRLKENIVDLPSATDAIKALRPVNFNFKTHPGKTRPGFIAHEVSETLPVAVTGEKDATEAIGTLADYDGTVLETEVTEPPAEELTYTEEVETDGVSTQEVRTRTWTATGTRPVYQGVDQTKLIPLLTKALQEVLTKNEDLEARIAALEGA